ncbi:Fe-S cluster assembly protein SufD [Horticoccus sp. 23ND18S-11]|uniref:Fe-S cluster assembly protein SufD n=1 Tax=Horticoccus sp. 23ND18S-11 TaxID=3391832 RepID=UPI0039C97EE9
MSAPVLTSPAKSLVGSFTADAFAAHLASLPPLPAWWLDRKRAAFERFSALPMPVRTDEAWRFSNISTLTLDGFTLAAPATSVPHAPIGIPKAAKLVFANGRLFSRETLPADLAQRGVIVDTLQNALVQHGDLVREHLLAQPPKLGGAKFSALHEAFLTDGAFIYVPKGVDVELPIGVFSYALGDTTAVFPHTLVVAGENSRVTVIEYFGSANDTQAQFAAGANDLYAGHGAQITYVGKQDWSHRTLSFQSNSTVVRRDARVQSLNLHLGGRQARHESLSQLQAPGAFSEMLALTVAHDEQEFDQRTLQIHQAPNTKSDLLYKNALLNRARTIFSGLIIVDPDAQKTDAYQSNRNLMLSEDAEANSLPGLEIQANDVRCTHGATSSRIDPEQEFYLQSRGIAKAAADELLTFGFFEEVLNRLTNDDLHAALRTLIQTKFTK